MPLVERAGARIHWEERGAGPLVVVAHHTLWSYPGVYAGLVSELARDHRVVLPDPRGCGQSTVTGPYDAKTDALDLLAVVEAAGEGAVAIGVGDGFNRAVRVAAQRPDLISEVIVVGPAAAAVLPRSELKGSGVLAGSDSVAEMVLQMMSTDPRAALSSLIATVNPDLDEEQLRERVDRVAAYQATEGALARVRVWMNDDVSEYARALGDRLLVLHAGEERLYEGALGERVTKLFPQAQLAEVPHGPVSRPDLTAARVRRLTGAGSRVRPG